MADLSYSVDVNTTGAVTGLQKLQDKVGILSKTFTGLQTAMAGLFLGATITKALAYADAISDISVSTNIAIANVLGFSHAVEQNGGTAEGAQKALGKFGITIGEAADGSDKAQNAFAKVGVTLNDLRTMSEKDLLRKTIYGLSQIADASKRAAAQNDVFGKSMRGVDMVGVQGSYAYATVESMKYAAAVKSAGDVQDKLAAAFNRFQLSLLNAMKPLADFLNNLKPEQIEKFIDAIIKIGGATSVFIGISKAISWIIAGITTLTAWWVAGTGLMAKGSAALSEAFAGISLMVGNLIKNFKLIWSGAAEIGGGFARLSVVVRAVFGAFAEPLAVGALALGSFATGIGEVAAVLLGLAAITWTVGEAIDAVFGTRIISGFADGVTYIWNKMKDIAGFKPAAPEGPKGRSYSAEDTKQMNLYVQGLADAEKVARDLKSALDAKINSIQGATRAYIEQNTSLLSLLKFEGEMVGITADENEVWRAQRKVLEDASAAIAKLTEEKKAHQAARKETETDLSPYYDAEIKKIRELGWTQAHEIDIAITKNQGLKAIEKARLQDIENITKAIEDQIARQQTLGGLLQGANDKRVDVAFEGAQAKRNPLEKQMAQIQEDARKAALEAGRAFSAGFEGMDLSTEQAKELADGLAVIADRYKGIADAQSANLTASRDWSAGWKDAFDNYVEHATNAATKAGEQFSAITTGMNSAIDNFVDNGKFSFEDMATSIIKDLVKIEMKALAMEGLKGLFGSSGGGGGLLSTIGSFIGGFFADGGQPPMNKASIVGEKGPELFVPRSAGTIVPNNALGGGGQVVNNNTNVTNNHYTVNAVDAKSVAQLFAENRKQLLGTVRMAQAEQPYAARL